MSTPMFDIPEHIQIGVNANGDGPVFGDEIDRIVCWCGVPGCELWRPSTEEVKGEDQGCD